MYEYRPPQAPPPQQPMYYRPEKSYLGEAFLTLALYYLGVGVVGLIANIMFLNNANRDERQGMLVRNKGCLTALLWVHVIGMILGCIATIIFVFFLGGMAILQGMLGS